MRYSTANSCGYILQYIDSEVLLGVDRSERRGTALATAFLQQLTEKHDLSDTEFLGDGYGYPTVVFRLDLSAHLDYVNRNHIEKWSHTLEMRADRVHNSWVRSRLPSPIVLYYLCTTIVFNDHTKR